MYIGIIDSGDWVFYVQDDKTREKVKKNLSFLWSRKIEK